MECVSEQFSFILCQRVAQKKNNIEKNSLPAFYLILTYVVCCHLQQTSLIIKKAVTITGSPNCSLILLSRSTPCPTFFIP